MTDYKGNELPPVEDDGGADYGSAFRALGEERRLFGHPDPSSDRATIPDTEAERERVAHGDYRPTGDRA